MSNTVKALKLTYNPPNERNVFTDGDWVSGHVTLEVCKECHVGSLSVKFKGKAEVEWQELEGRLVEVFSEQNKYFSIKRYFIRGEERREECEDEDEEPRFTDQHGQTYSNVLSPGCHVYPFMLQFPPLDLPSSFKASEGKIVYLLEARLSRSMRMAKTEVAKINFVSKTDLRSDPELMASQQKFKEKKLKVFASGTVSMHVKIDKTGFYQGEGLKVVIHVENDSSRTVKPKYRVYRKHSFFAEGERKVDTKDLLGEVGQPVPPGTNAVVTCILTIPPDAEPSILNCNIISVEHRLRVYLDVKFASDPEIKFPIVILPVLPAASSPPGCGFPDVAPVPSEPAAWGLGHQDAPPPSYESHAMYPPLTDYRTGV